MSEEITLYSIICALLIGLNEVKGELIVKDKPSIFSQREIHRVVCLLTREFPLFFPDVYCREGPTPKTIPVSGKIEDILSGMIDFNDNNGNLVIQPEMKELIKDILMEKYGKETLKRVIPVTRRFNILINTKHRKED